jgi:hypothetical protein
MNKTRDSPPIYLSSAIASRLHGTQHISLRFISLDILIHIPHFCIALRFPSLERLTGLGYVFWIES